jgi:hypothetical protein
MIFSSLAHPIPKPSSRYKLIAEALRECGQDINDNDYDAIDNLPTDDAEPERPAIWLVES